VVVFIGIPDQSEVTIFYFLRKLTVDQDESMIERDLQLTVKTEKYALDYPVEARSLKYA